MKDLRIKTARYYWRKRRSELWRTWLFRLLFPREWWALNWYADDHHWNAMLADRSASLAQDDAGNHAREALESD